MILIPIHHISVIIQFGKKIYFDEFFKKNSSLKRTLFPLCSIELQTFFEMISTKYLIRFLCYLFFIDFNISLVTLTRIYIIFMKITILEVNWVRRLKSASPDTIMTVLPSSQNAGTHVAGDRLWQRLLSLPIKKKKHGV